MRNFIKRTLMTIAAIVVVIILLFIWFTIKDYKPGKTEILEQTMKDKAICEPGTELSVISWNIGYAGLGENMDFFYDGGKMVEPPRIYYQICLNGIINQLNTMDIPDFFIFQEVDINSARSYYTDQAKLIQGLFPGMLHVFANNYKVPFVPVPWHHPMGKVNAGLLSLFRYQSDSALRISLPGDYKWPVKLFMLDRCFTFNSFPVRNGKKLILINTHNEAFDKGDMRIAQLKALKEVMENEYTRGNYVVAGGDWNQNPPGFDSTLLDKKYRTFSVKPSIDKNLLPEGWKWIYQQDLPTNRKVDEPYKAGHTPVTIIDFFVVSPNIKVNSIKTYPFDFLYSDHNPVEMKFELLP